MSKLGLEKEEELQIKLPTFAGLWKKQGNFRKTSISVSSTTFKAFDCVDHDRLESIPDQLTCPLRKLYVSQEATVGTLYGTTDWFKIEKGVRQGCLLSSCLFNLYTEHIMRNARLDELQARIKISGRNISNLRYVDDTPVMAESEEELKSLLMRVKEKSERAGLRLNIKKK